ncbi:uncharacterized protein LOC101209809 [Cucumis sativus]|uniref:HMA domain-containing protein n=1 Tax=Cucumis sativus TaxID=3659 RepID=A0A0A0K866_CUCSA|nr:uncharacterized protein LOC101209809 [Cucumis sativus]KGN45950.1 hypothetical protein Csa_005029 [Cucumis sativus]
MSELKQFCMVMKINVDCNACCRKLRRIVKKMKAIETYMIERERHRLIVFGRFKPSDIAIKIRKKMNRRVEILDVEEMEPLQATDQNSPPPENIQGLGSGPGPGPNVDQHHMPMFPSLEQDHGRPSMFPSLAANQCRSHPSCRSDFAITCFPKPDMEERFWQYGYDYELVGDREERPTISIHNYYHY